MSSPTAAPLFVREVLPHPHPIIGSCGPNSQDPLPTNWTTADGRPVLFYGTYIYLGLASLDSLSPWLCSVRATRWLSPFMYPTNSFNWMRVGDLIQVTEMTDDGWWRGVLLDPLAAGMDSRVRDRFPANHTCLV